MSDDAHNVVPWSLYKRISLRYYTRATSRYIPTVVPAELMEKTKPLRFSSLCTSAISADTEALPVPIGTRQKSAIHAEGVCREGRLTVLLGGGGIMSRS